MAAHTILHMQKSIIAEPALVEDRRSSETRERVLDVAERLSAERGLNAVSVRDITGAAGVNLGAINYHFGTKEKRIVAVLKRRSVPLGQRRLYALEVVEKRAGKGMPTLRSLRRRRP